MNKNKNYFKEFIEDKEYAEIYMKGVNRFANNLVNDQTKLNYKYKKYYLNNTYLNNLIFTEQKWGNKYKNYGQAFMYLIDEIANYFNEHKPDFQNKIKLIGTTETKNFNKSGIHISNSYTLAFPYLLSEIDKNSFKGRQYKWVSKSSIPDEFYMLNSKIDGKTILENCVENLLSKKKDEYRLIIKMSNVFFRKKTIYCT